MIRNFDLTQESLLTLHETKTPPKSDMKNLIIFWCVLYGLILIRDFFSVSFPVQLITGLLTVLCINSKKETIVKYAVSLIPVAQAVQFSTLIGIMAIIILLRNRKPHLSRVSLLFFMLMVMELFHCIIPPFSLLAYINFACTYVFLIVIFADNDRYKFLDADTVIAFVISAIIANIIVIILTLKSNSFNIAYVIQNNWRVGNTFAEDDLIGYRLSNNPNGIGFQMIIAISSAITLYISKVIKTKSFIILTCISLFIGILSISRTFLVAFVAMIIMMCLCVQRQNAKRLFRIILFVTIILLIIYSITPEVINNIISRFRDSESTATMGSRTLITQKYLEVFSNDLLKTIFGVGMQSLQAKTGVMMNPHNSIIDVFVAWGVIGVIITVVLFISMFSDLKKYKRMYIYALPILCMILYSMSGRIFKSAYVMILFVVVASDLNMHNVMNCSLGGENHE